LRSTKYDVDPKPHHFKPEFPISTLSLHRNYTAAAPLLSISDRIATSMPYAYVYMLLQRERSSTTDHEAATETWANARTGIYKKHDQTGFRDAWMEVDADYADRIRDVRFIYELANLPNGG